MYIHIHSRIFLCSTVFGFWVWEISRAFRQISPSLSNFRTFVPNSCAETLRSKACVSISLICAYFARFVRSLHTLLPLLSSSCCCFVSARSSKEGTRWEFQVVYMYSHIDIYMYIYIYVQTYIYIYTIGMIPLVPHKAVAEVSKTGNL